MVAIPARGASRSVDPPAKERGPGHARSIAGANQVEGANEVTVQISGYGFRRRPGRWRLVSRSTRRPGMPGLQPTETPVRAAPGGGWRCHYAAGEARTCVPSQVVADARLAQATTLSYAIQVTSAAIGTRLVLAELARRPVPSHRSVLSVSDGAVWIPEVLALHCPQAIRVLDFAHAAEYLAQAAPASPGRGMARTRRAWQPAAGVCVKRLVNVLLVSPRCLVQGLHPWSYSTEGLTRPLPHPHVLIPSTP